MSNPTLCQHSMVTDLCGLCIRDERIARLEQQRDELVAGLMQAQMDLQAIKLCLHLRDTDFAQTAIVRITDLLERVNA